jgi:hypothetical protein
MELNEKTLRAILTEQREEYQQFIGVAVEEFKSPVKQVAEGQDVLREQFERKQSEFQKTQADFATDFGRALHLVSGTLKGVQQELAALNNMIRKNTEDIEMTRSDIDIIKADLSIIRSDLKQKVGRDELAVLEARVAKLELSQRSGRA